MFLFLRNNGIYFNKEELEMESKGCNFYNNKEEILEKCKSLECFKVVGFTSLKLKENIEKICKKKINKEENIYIVKLLKDKFCFCSCYGKVLNIEL